MNTNKKLKKLNIKVKIKPKSDLASNSETENPTTETPVPVKVTGFERTVSDSLSSKSDYWFVADDGNLIFERDIGYCSDDNLFKTANYYTDKNLAEWCRCSDELTRKMRRWAAEHNVEPFDWQCGNYEKYYITFDAAFYEFNIYSNTFCPYPNTVYFNTKEIAELAIKEFGNEIEWLAENRPEWF